MYIYADTCCKPYVVGSSNIKIQDVSQIKLLICITNQVSSHCDAEITIETRRSNATNPKGTHPVPTSESACSKLKKAPSAFGLSLLHRLAMSVLHRRTSNYISEFGLCRASNLFFSCLLCLQCHISGTSNISKHSDTFEPS